MRRDKVRVATPCVTQPPTRMVLLEGWVRLRPDGAVESGCLAHPVLGLVTYPLILSVDDDDFDITEQCPRLSALVLANGELVLHDDRHSFPDQGLVTLVACPWPPSEDGERLAGPATACRMHAVKLARAGATA